MANQNIDLFIRIMNVRQKLTDNLNISSLSLYSGRSVHNQLRLTELSYPVARLNANMSFSNQNNRFNRDRSRSRWQDSARCIASTRIWLLYYRRRYQDVTDLCTFSWQPIWQLVARDLRRRASSDEVARCSGHRHVTGTRHINGQMSEDRVHRKPVTTSSDESTIYVLA